MAEQVSSACDLENEPDNCFCTDHLMENLEHRSLRGGALTMIGQAAKLCLQVGSTAALARLLTPGDFGLVAMVATFTNFINLFKDLGLSLATVQRATITHNQVSALFWINVAVSAVLMMITVALAPVAAWFYGEPRLTGIMLAMAGTFLFGGLTAQHAALLQRQMRFAGLAGVDVTSMAAGGATAIVMSCLGFGYWALVGMGMVAPATYMILVWMFVPWRPTSPRGEQGIGSMLGFGGHLTGVSVLGYVAKNADNVLIGRYLGSAALGLYSRAYHLLLLPIHQINAPLAAVAIPALCRLQEDDDRDRRYYYTAISAIAWATMPLALGMAALADEIILLFLGPQWALAAEVFQVLAFAALLQPLVNTTGWIYVSLNQTARMLRFSSVSVPIFTAALVLGLSWGILGVARAYTLCSLVVAPFCLWYAYRHSPIRVKRVLLSALPPLGLSLLMWASIAWARPYFADWDLVARLAGLVVLGGSVFLAGALLWPEARRNLGMVLNMARTLRAGKR